MKRFQRILQSKILTKKSNVTSISTKGLEVPNSVINKKKVLERYKNAWYSELNNQYESSDSSGSEIDDDMGYIRMKRNKLRSIEQHNLNQSNIYEYSSGQYGFHEKEQDGRIQHGNYSIDVASSNGKCPERDKQTGKDENVTKKLFMKTSFDYLSCNIDKPNEDVIVCEGEIVKVIDHSNVKRVTIETVYGAKIKIPSCYLVDMTREEMEKILYDEKERENIKKQNQNLTLVSEGTIRNSKREKKSVKKKKENNGDSYLDKQTENVQHNSTSHKKCRKNSFSEYWNKKLSSLSKYTSLAENLDQQGSSDQQDDDNLFHYKINPAHQRKLKSKSPIIFDHDNEIWIDGMPSSNQQNNDETSCNHRNNIINNELLNEEDALLKQIEELNNLTFDENGLLKI